MVRNQVVVWFGGDFQRRLRAESYALSKQDSGTSIAPQDLIAFWQAGGPAKWFTKD